MKTFQEKSGRPGTSFSETSFGGNEDISRRLENLRENRETGIIIDGSKVPENFDISLLGDDFKKSYINRAENFIKKIYPYYTKDALNIGFFKNTLELYVKGDQGGLTKVFLADGSDFQKNFLGKGFVINKFGPPAEDIIQRKSEEISQKQKELKDLRKSEKFKRDKNEDIERLNERINMEKAKLEQLKEGQEDKAETERKQQLIKNMEKDLKDKKKEVKGLEKKWKNSKKHEKRSADLKLAFLKNRPKETPWKKVL